MSKKFYEVTDNGIDKRAMTEEEYSELYDHGVVFSTFEEAATFAIRALSDRVKELERK